MPLLENKCKEIHLVRKQILSDPDSNVGYGFGSKLQKGNRDENLDYKLL